MAAFQNMRALVAEDETLLADVVAWAVEDAGFEVQTASNGDEAIGMFRSGSFDLLVTDIRMPGKTDGWALASHVRLTSPDIPIVFVSGYTPDSPSLPSRSAFVQKPFLPEDLIAAIELTFDGLKNS